MARAMVARADSGSFSDAPSSKECLMATGTVKWFNAQRGYGFIEPSDGSKDVFVHVTAVQGAGMDTLSEGQKISFDVTNERGKPSATNLKAA
jgi:CspA family cold shock protein